MASKTVASSNPRAEELLVFTQILQTAKSGNVPLSRFLNEAASNLPPGRAADWAARLGTGMAEGRSPSDVLNGMTDMDEVLAALLSIPGGLGLKEVLAAYVRHLVSITQLDEQLRTAIFHPCMVLWLSVANMVLINMHLFPAMAAGFSEQSGGMPFFLKLWYIASPETWPLSWFLPAILIFMAITMTRTLFFAPPHEESEMLFGKLIGLGRFVSSEEQGRLFGTLALFLEAGKSLSQALRWTAKHGGARRFQAEFLRAAEKLEQGIPPMEALAAGPALQPLALGWVEKGDDSLLIERLRFMAEAHFVSANRFLGTIETLGTVVGLLLVGVVVLLLCLAFFQPYWTYAGNGGGLAGH